VITVCVSRGRLFIYPVDVFLFHKGVIWLVLALVAEVPPVVSPTKIPARLVFVHLHIMQIFVILNLNGITFRPNLCLTSTESHPPWNTSSI
jgi:hypothetical protein